MNEPDPSTGVPAVTTTTRRTKAATITRTTTISFALCGTCEVRVSETKGNTTTTDTYLLTRQPSDFGVAFSIRKCDSTDTYDVCLNMLGGGHSCDCKWGTYKSHIKPCRHVEACLQALREHQL
jgi:hypothetical protein